MNSIFKKSIILTAIMAMSLGVYAENEPPAANDKINVTVLAAGQSCPAKGKVESKWMWKHSVFPNQFAENSGTSFIYTSVPFTGQCASIHPGVPWWFYPESVEIKVIPDGHSYAAKSIRVFPPFNPIGVTPGPCFGNEKGLPDPNSTD